MLNKNFDADVEPKILVIIGNPMRAWWTMIGTMLGVVPITGGTPLLLAIEAATKS